ncbi:MAG TPA: septum formation initiator family protein [Acidimicrobiales bacterium]|nr:septum formation initiator family protein [Acidimicrobiales bacterium]
MRLMFRVAILLLFMAGSAYLFAYPTRTYLDQRRQIAAQEETISLLDAENSKLAAERAALQSNATIEKLARQEYGLVMPGQQAFMVLPAPAAPVRPAPQVHRSRPWYASLEFWHHL